MKNLSSPAYSLFNMLPDRSGSTGIQNYEAIAVIFHRCDFPTVITFLFNLELKMDKNIVSISVVGIRVSGMKFLDILAMSLLKNRLFTVC